MNPVPPTLRYLRFVILPRTSSGPVSRELLERSKYINLSIDHESGIVLAMFG